MIFPVLFPKPLPSAGDYPQEVEAELKLAEMDRHENLAAEAKAATSFGYVFADRYRELIGVAPEQRHKLRAALERIRAGGGQSVENVIAILRRQSSGLLSEGGGTC